MRKKVLVTGGAGYIGSHTVVELYNSGYLPIIVDNLCNSSIVNLRGINKILENNIKWYDVDCTDFNLMNDIFKIETNISFCIHFAAFKSVEESVLNPKKYYDNNIGSLQVLLKCMNKYQINNLIFSSSCTVYGMPDLLPVDENAPFKEPESPYAETKQKCEDIIRMSKTSSVALRYFNPIGSHVSSLIGDCSDDNASNLVPIICEVASGLRKEIIVFGDDYDTVDGTCIRDYVHVQDLARAHVCALKYLSSNNGKYIFNVGVGKGFSVLEVINSFEKNNHLKINYKIGDRRLGDIEKIFSNGDAIKEKLNWEPLFGLDKALKDAWSWQKNKNV